MIILSSTCVESVLLWSEKTFETPSFDDPNFDYAVNVMVGFVENNRPETSVVMNVTFVAIVFCSVFLLTRAPRASFYSLTKGLFVVS